MDKLTNSLKKVSVKPETTVCKYCGKEMNATNISRHHKSKKCRYAKIGWEIQRHQAAIDIHKQQIEVLIKERENFDR